MQRIYLDYASTTPLDPKVEAAMRPYLSGKFGNPSSLHSFGQEAMAALDKSRETIANLIGAKFGEIIFTSSATEANNMALRGAVKQFSIFNFQFSKKEKPRIIVSAIEHESVLETAKDLEKDGVEVAYLPVSRTGQVALGQLEKLLDERTILVSVMYANNETGTIQNISEISKIIRNFRNSKELTTNELMSYPLLHTDAVQAFQYLDCNVDNLGVDLMTLSSHKIYGPKGAGALYIRSMNNELRIKNNKFKIHDSKFMIPSKLVLPILTGGGQEFEMRSGTENIPAIVGFAKAAELVSNSRELENKRIGRLRDHLWVGIKKSVKGAKLNGSADSPQAARRLPNNLNVYFPDTSSEEMLIRLDLNGIAVSAGSACAARSLEPPHVLLSMGFDEKRAKSSIRFTLGRMTTKDEVDKVLTTIKILFK